MGKVLRHNVVIRQSLTSPAISFKKGEELPEWAAELVGAHLYEEKLPEPVYTRVKKTGIPSAPPKVEEPVEVEVPAGNASRIKFAKFLEFHGVDFPEDASRDELKEIAKEKLDGIEF